MNTLNKNESWVAVGAVVFAVFILSPLFSAAQGYDTTTPYPGSGGSSITACTRDAMQCPDGTFVGRTGPNCEFVCPGDTPTTPPSVDFTASPKSGSAPLTVTFATSLTEPQYYYIHFGDNTSGTFSICAESYPNRCSISHTYRANGTYNAQLIYDRCGLSTDSVRCMAPASVVASITIRVGGSVTPGSVPGSGDVGDEDGFVSVENPNPDDTADYWTPERMRDAQGLPMGRYFPQASYDGYWMPESIRNAQSVEMGVFVEEDASNQTWLNRLSGFISNIFLSWSLW